MGRLDAYFAQALDDVRTNRGIDRIVRCGMCGRIVAGFGDFGSFFSGFFSADLCYAINHGLPHALARELADITIVVIILSIVAHGMSMQPLLKRYWRA